MSEFVYLLHVMVPRFDGFKFGESRQIGILTTPERAEEIALSYISALNKSPFWRYPTDPDKFRRIEFGPSVTWLNFNDGVQVATINKIRLDIENRVQVFTQEGNMPEHLVWEWAPS